MADSKNKGGAGAAGDDLLPHVDFATFVLSLSHSALMHLGDAPDPETGSVERTCRWRARRSISSPCSRRRRRATSSARKSASSPRFSSICACASSSSRSRSDAPGRRGRCRSVSRRHAGRRRVRATAARGPRGPEHGPSAGRHALGERGRRRASAAPSTAPSPATGADLHAAPVSFAPIAHRADPSVVTITTVEEQTEISPFTGRVRRRESGGLGTGFVIDKSAPS